MSKSPTIVDSSGLPIKGSSFIGASDGFGGELASWKASSQSIDSALLPTFDTANARASDLARNHGYGKSGVQLHIDHIVGNQFKLVYKPNYRVLGITPEQAREFAKDVEARFTDWAEDPDCYIDAERKRTFTMLMREGAGTHCKTGEITSKVEVIRGRGTPYLTSIKTVNYARVCNPNGVMDSQRLRAGVRMNRHGAAVGYYVRKGYLSDYFWGNRDVNKWVYVPRYLPWGRQQFLHYFEPEDADQTRGVNNMLAAMSKMKMLEKFQSTTLQNAIINAMYAAVVESDMPSDEIFRALNGNESTNNLSKFMNLKSEWHDQTNITLNGSKIAHLLPNEKLKMMGVNSPNASLNDFESGIVRYMAASLGVSYEQLAKDFSKTNYSSARASILESYRYFMGKRATIIARYATSVFALWLEEAVNIGKVTLPGGGNFYDNKSAWTRSSWIGAGRSQIDGLKEVKEAVLRIESGLSTYEKECSLMGDDYIEIFDQQLREAKELEEQGRTPLWMNSQVAEDEGEDESDDDEEDEDKKTVDPANESPGVHEQNG